MASEWQEVQLGDVACLMTGYPFKSQHYTDDASAPRLIGGDNIAQGNLRWDSVRRWPRDMTSRLDDYWLEPGDVVLAMDRPWIEAGLKRAAVGPQDVPSLLVQRTARLRGTSRLDTAFLRYVIGSRAFAEYILSVQTGTAVPHISLAQIRTFRFTLPPFAEQRGIAKTLGALDDHIDNLRQTNATLEAIAAALFKSWFVDFDGVAQEDMQESELGLIPKGWRVVPAGEIYDVGIGKTPPRKEQHWFTENKDDVPWASIKDMGDSGLFIGSTSEYLTGEAVEKFNIRRVPAETVLLSFKLTVGRLAMTDTEMTTNEAIAHFKPKPDSLSKCYLYCYLKQYDFMRLGSTSSIATATNSKAIRELPVLHPGNELARKFNTIVAPLFQKIGTQQQQATTLVTLRDTLLPRLISGQLRIADIELALEDALNKRSIV